MTWHPAESFQRGVPLRYAIDYLRGLQFPTTKQSVTCKLSHKADKDNPPESEDSGGSTLKLDQPSLIPKE